MGRWYTAELVILEGRQRDQILSALLSIIPTPRDLLKYGLTSVVE